MRPDDQDKDEHSMEKDDNNEEEGMWGTYSECDKFLFTIFENSRSDVFTIFKTCHTYV